MIEAKASDDVKISNGTDSVTVNGQTWLYYRSVYLDVQRRESDKGRLLDYLIGVAQDTQGSEVWRALFAEMRLNVARHSGS